MSRTPKEQARQNLRRQLHRLVKNESKRHSKTVGCSGEFLVKYLEKQFSENMNWQNYGDVWHIDHRIPLSHFDITDPDQRRISCHYLNLRPLLSEHNMARTLKLQTKHHSRKKRIKKKLDIGGKINIVKANSINN